MNNKKLVLILVALLGIWGISKLFSGERDKSFKTELIKIDTASVNKILLNTGADNFEDVILTKEGNDWFVSKNNFTTKASEGSIKPLLDQLALVKTKRIAAKSEKKWKDYEVEDGNSARLRIYNGSKLLEDVIVGKFSFNQQAKTMTSFVRLNGSPEVYAVDGMMSMNAKRDFNSFRNKALATVAKDKAIHIGYTNNIDSTQIDLLYSNNNWMNKDVIADSTKIANYLNGLSNLNGADFSNTFDEVKAKELLQEAVSIRTSDNTNPIVIYCYKNEGDKPFVIHSTLNKDAYFLSDSTGIYQTIFGELKSI